MIYLYEKLTDVTVIISVLLAIGIITNFHKLSSTLKIVGIYLIAGASIDIVASALSRKYESNLVFLHLFSLFEIVIISYLFKQLFHVLKSKFNVYHVAVPATIFVIINSCFIQSIHIYNSYSSTLVSTIILGYSIYFFKSILDIEILNLQFKILKWFIICLFFFHSTSLIIMLFGNLFQEMSIEAQSSIWSIRALVIFVTKIIITYWFLRLLIFKNKSDVV